MNSSITAEQLLRLRLSAQALSPAAQARDAHAATQRIVGVQAQDVRAARLALRSRVPGLTAADVDGARELVRTWTLRGTVHLHHAQDLPWLEALLRTRNLRYYDGLMRKRGNYDRARRLLGPIEAVLGERGPIDRAALLQELTLRGEPELLGPSINVLIPWACAQGLVIGLPDGRLRLAQALEPIDPEQALATLARRYLEGYGPAAAEDLAVWSGLPLGQARRAFAAAGTLEQLGEGLLALPGAVDAPAGDLPPMMLAAFDVLMLGYRSREPVLDPAHRLRFLPGGGMLRPLLLVDGRARATWRITGSGRRRTAAFDWFGAPVAHGLLETELTDVGRFLGVELS